MGITKLLADGLLIVVLFVGGAAGLLGFAWHRWRTVAPYGIMAGLTSLLAGKVMSIIYQPSITRPFAEQGVSPGAAYINNPGFPSDHVLLGTVVVLAVYYLTPYRRLSYLLGILTLVMGVARVAALVHSPVDIAGGLVAGMVGIIWYRRLKKA